MPHRSSVLNRKVALAFMAHPDDAEISCGGTLVRLQESGWEVHITSVTAGDCGSMSEGPEETARIRFAEGVNAAESIGATFHTLGEPDGRLVYDRVSLQKSIDLFRRIAPTLVITMPMSDYHADHEITGQLGRAASFVYAAPNASEEPVIEGSQVPYLYYTDGHDGEDRMGNAITPTTFIDISDQLETKTQMLAHHKSQLEWLRSHNGIDEYLTAMREHSRSRGTDIGTQAAEAFVQHRGHGHPSDDLLATLFPNDKSSLSIDSALQATHS
ncbi:PIG-L deacetylase family protein [Rhodopirellula bahusiensis]|uniref:PIG-L domain-containing protein n=1 Tax=Rhodopirellula bahusiensis TaxID=2014065 RepID=A0A2G1W535_9BACT|nr:PIG-L family deacetylase [Rhodopirellula bahusiensis]PHQ34125.1 PIG-L domain-containing protein [Rhodopirellula bahusiensis]